MTRKRYRSIYESYHGKIPVDEFGRTYDIHHLDGDVENNSVENLVAVSIKEHFEIHLRQGDRGACFAISLRMNKTKEELSVLSSNAQRDLIESGDHHFVDGEWQRENQLNRVRNGTHPFQGDKNPARMKVADGTYHMLKEDNPSKKRVDDGTHNFLGPDSPSQQVWHCPYCGKHGKGKGIYTRFHGNNCKNKGNE